MKLISSAAALAATALVLSTQAAAQAPIREFPVSASVTFNQRLAGVDHPTNTLLVSLREMTPGSNEFSQPYAGRSTTLWNDDAEVIRHCHNLMVALMISGNRALSVRFGGTNVPASQSAGESMKVHTCSVEP